MKSVKNELTLARDTIGFLKTKDVFNEEADKIHFATGDAKSPSRTKLVLINTLVALNDKNTNEATGCINVNVQDDNVIWIEYISELIHLYLDESIIGEYKLEYTTEHLFKVSKDLHFKNLKFKFQSI